MANPGIAPLNPTTAIGRVRLNLGDTEYTPLNPPVTGKGDYAYFSDQAIEAFIESASGNEANATGFGYLQLAAIAAVSSASVTTDDLQADITKRATDLRQIAAAWFAQGKEQDNSAGLNEYFAIVPYGGKRNYAELAEFPTHWAY